MSLRCRLGFHTTVCPYDREWHATWRCTRCGKDLR